jgi:hypothetical protein
LQGAAQHQLASQHANVQQHKEEGQVQCRHPLFSLR